MAGNPWDPSTAFKGTGGAVGQSSPAAPGVTAPAQSPAPAPTDHWSPGQAAPLAGTPAYSEWEAYGRGQANAGAAANAAGNAATAAHTQQVQAKAAADKKASGLDMMQPGALESYWDQYGKQLQDPSATATFRQQNGAMPQQKMAEDYAQKVLDKYGGGSNLPENPGLDPYYDRAEQRAMQQINGQLSARGSYGSSVGLGQLGTAVTDLEAEKANREADYALKRSSDSRDWTSAVGNIAQAGEQAGTSRWNSGLGGAGQEDTAGLARWMAGSQSAGSAQAAQRARGQDLFNNNITIGDRLSGVVGPAYTGEIKSDSDILDGINAVLLGKGKEGVSKGTHDDAANQAFSQQTLDAVRAYFAQHPEAMGGGGASPGAQGSAAGQSAYNNGRLPY